MHTLLQRYFLPYVLILPAVLTHQVLASEAAASESGIDWASILVGVFILLIIAGAIGLSRYVKKQRENHVQVMIWMYCSVLDGRLRNLIINLQDSVELLCSDNYQNELLSVSQDSFWRLGNRQLRADFLDLAEKSGLGELPVQDIIYGFECLEEAIAYMKTLSNERGGRLEMLARFEREQLQDLLLGATQAFEDVKRRVCP